MESYPIVIDNGLLSRLGTLVDLTGYSKIGVVTDQLVSGLYGDQLTKGIGSEPEFIVVPNGETAKNHETLVSIWNHLKDAHFDRSSLLINLGGGAIGDLGGFAASTYMRGIDFVQVPTTLLAQVDASVGGKVAINLSGAKNIVGSFQQPVAVIADLGTLLSLPERELRAGYAEVIKHGFIYDAEYLNLAAVQDLAKPEDVNWSKIVQGSVRIKSEVVTEDEREGGIRKILNFGHTIGHALESLSYSESEAPLLHGEAIALGMIAEAVMSVEVGLLAQSECDRIVEVLSAVSLPTKVPFDVDLAQVLELIQSDKKTTHGEAKWTLLRAIGEASFDNHASDDVVAIALKEITS